MMTARVRTHVANHAILGDIARTLVLAYEPGCGRNVVVASFGTVDRNSALKWRKASWLHRKHPKDRSLRP
jgi:hypothetical protein